ncbi:transcriptional regulator [Rhodococcus sp. 14-2470-1b]|uniref:winged helix-turn-helix transcriptional regulator n=1 Tax=unclassified Rhodococcus (in: high G+C Gram-positive bacteria) TaxID=192944 RepID=UPI000B9C6CA7|nr:helix-turn-helix domain-containing protein [Rhodococcus sp. 14-2470-1b]OZF49547.1 transcriptional regulator [Rhodococcus sp. 14-2470-1b]
MPHEPTASNGCPITPVVDLVFSRWTTPILWTLHHEGPMRFSELRARIGATAKVLTDRLRQLERDGLVTRTMYPVVPLRVDYEITALGSSLQPVFSALVTWSDENLAHVTTSRNTFDEASAPGNPWAR